MWLTFISSGLKAELHPWASMGLVCRSHAVRIIPVLIFWVMNSSCNPAPGSEAVRETSATPLLQPDTTANPETESQPQHVPGNPSDSAISVMVLPCANGYDYSTSNYDLDVLLAETLEGIGSCQVVPVPYHKLKGRGYHGVFDKKDCGWVLEHTVAEFLLLSRIEGDLFASSTDENGHWGYRTRLLNTRTLEQTEFIEDHDLKRFAELEHSVRTTLPGAWSEHMKR